MSRVQPPGSPCGSPFWTPKAANLFVGAQVASVGLMYLLIENGLLEVKWLSKATPFAVRARAERGLQARVDGAVEPRRRLVGRDEVGVVLEQARDRVAGLVDLGRAGRRRASGRSPSPSRPFPTCRRGCRSCGSPRRSPRGACSRRWTAWASPRFRHRPACSARRRWPGRRRGRGQWCGSSGDMLLTPERRTGRTRHRAVPEGARDRVRNAHRDHADGAARLQARLQDAGGLLAPPGR